MWGGMFPLMASRRLWPFLAGASGLPCGRCFVMMRRMNGELATSGARTFCVRCAECMRRGGAWARGLLAVLAVGLGSGLEACSLGRPME